MATPLNVTRSVTWPPGWELVFLSVFPWLSISCVEIVFIAGGSLCLGLLGLVMFSAQQRTKEIGIRKVLGATVANILLLISKDFLVLVVISFIIAAPVAAYLMGEWL